MADGLHAGDSVGDVIEKTSVKNYEIVMDYKKTIDESVNGREDASVNVNAFYTKRDSAKLFVNLSAKNGSKHEGLLLAGSEEDCRKKRCVDRYDSSESSDSGLLEEYCSEWLAALFWDLCSLCFSVLGCQVEYKHDRKFLKDEKLNGWISTDVADENIDVVQCLLQESR
ncbi:hypothetical protein ABEB36_004251 [Hypothenemus hampei]|uniref:Uncharacterized protein n=1 Tax=Hypothenemus hampei TaxID=57062 RepID=A0ABD1F2R0_HYPHA